MMIGGVNGEGDRRAGLPLLRTGLLSWEGEGEGEVPWNECKRGRVACGGESDD